MEALHSFEQPEAANRLTAALDGLMQIDSYTKEESGAIRLRGQLDSPSPVPYRAIRRQVEALGYTPFLRRSGEQDELLASPGVIARSKAAVALPVLLFAITVCTVLITGALNADAALAANPMLLLAEPARLLAGVPFAATLLSILLAHEMGHYVVGRIRHSPVSLPYFIPIPPIPTPLGVLTFTGTLGAVIVQREPMEDRRSVLEIGIAGPLAGLALAVPLLFYGLAHSSVEAIGSGGYMLKGNSLLYALAKYMVLGQVLPANGMDVMLNPVAWGAWIGLLVTMLNLLPVGQLDGGHVAYALLGRKADWLAYAMLALCVVLGVTVSGNWLIWGAMILLIGPRHPAPLNDIEPLDFYHKVLAVFGLILFVLLFMPEPIKIIGG